MITQDFEARSLKSKLAVFLILLFSPVTNGVKAFAQWLSLLFSLKFLVNCYLLLINDTRKFKAMIRASHGQYIPVQFVIMDPAVGLGDIIKAGLGFLFVGIFSIVILAVLGQFAAIATIWPAANVTKITTNIANSVVTGSAFLSILVVLIMVGFVFVVIGLLQALIT